MDAVVLGVGAAGEVTARLLAATDGLDGLRIADVRKERLEEVRRKIEGDVEALRANFGRAEDIRKACRGARIIVNASMPPYNLPIMREAIRNRAHYVDLASQGSPDPAEPSKVHAQLALDEAFRKVDRTAILGMGVAPGITNLLARRGTEPMDRVDAIRIRVYGSGYAEVEGHVFAPLFSPETFLEEVLWPAPVWKGDRIEKLKPFSNEEEFRFPNPLGVGVCYNVNNEECETMPLFIGKQVRFIDFKYAIAPRRKVLLESLYELGLTSPEPVRVKGKRVAPLDVLLAVLPPAASLAGRADGHTCVVVEVEGTARGRRKGARLWTILSHGEAHARMGVTATALLTGAPPAAAVAALLHEEIDRPGVSTGGGLDPSPILRRAMSLGVPLFEGPLGALRGETLAA